MTIWSPIVRRVEEVFRALGDPSRRLLLDGLFEQDGQTLGELCRHLPSMTRFGVIHAGCGSNLRVVYHPWRSRR